MYYVENKQSRVAACCDLPGDSFSFCKVSDLACHHTHRYVITTEHLRSSLSNLLIFLTLSLSEAERRVYHNWSLAEAPHHQRVSDTLMMPIHSAAALHSALPGILRKNLPNSPKSPIILGHPIFPSHPSVTSIPRVPSFSGIPFFPSHSLTPNVFH